MIRKGPPIMSPEQRQVIQDKRVATRSKVLSVGTWRIFRMDDSNIILERDGDDDNSETRGYYPDVPSALRALYRRLADPAKKSELKDVLVQMKATEDRILAAFDVSAAKNLFSEVGL